jgi:uncharacterized membrane protein YdbT with pleckstrin-like domain
MKAIETETWWRSCEVIGEIFLKVLGLCLVYLIFKFIGKWLVGENFTPDTLLSIVVLPAIYILKDTYQIFTPWSVTVTLSDSDITVKQGIFTQRLDCLKFDTIENVELITTVLGRYCNYGTLQLYSYGAGIEVPSIKDFKNIQSKIEARIQEKSK